MGFFKKKVDLATLVGMTIVFMDVPHEGKEIVFQATADGKTFTDYFLRANNTAYVELIDGNPADVLIDAPIEAIEVVSHFASSASAPFVKYRIQTALGRVEIFIFETYSEEDVEFYC